MVERGNDRRDRNEVSHPTRREVIRMLGGSALLGPLFVSGCLSRDPLGPDVDSNTQPLLDAQGNQGALPLILFVSGYTNLAPTLGFTKPELKEAYYASQKRRLANLERDWVDMNFVPSELQLNGTVLTFGGTGARNFDSNRKVIDCNAAAIGAFLGVCQEKGQRVTLVSHSKGGQDVLHALITHPELWDPAKLKGCPSTLSGWVAFTSNFFESEFAAEHGGACDASELPPLPILPFADLGSPCTLEDDEAGSLYTNYPKGDDVPHLAERGGQPLRNLHRARKRDRVDYMYDHQTTIAKLVECVPTLSLFATYVPKDDLLQFPPINNSGALDRTNKDIRQRYRLDSGNNEAEAPNDGLVPARAGQLPGATIRRLPWDPRIRNGNGPDGYKRKCGVDHMAPVVNVKNKSRRFWTNDFRNDKTVQYIREVEAIPSCPIEVEIDIMPGSGPNSINCHNPNTVIAVAILTNDCFDATTVDHTTVRLEGAPEMHVDNRSGLPRRHEKDVNGDGRPDLVFHFRLADADLGCSSTQARLEGTTFDGQPIVGVGSVRMVAGGTP